MASKQSQKLRQVLLAGMVVIGSLQMVGYLVGSQTLLGLGFLTNASPLPLVFSHFRGIEPFSATYQLEWTTRSGATASQAVTPAVYARLKGPYNLRHVYGTVFAAGPVLQQDPMEAKLWQTVMNRAFCRPGFLQQSFALPENLETVTLQLQGRATGMSDGWQKEVVCD